MKPSTFLSVGRIVKLSDINNIGIILKPMPSQSILKFVLTLATKLDQIGKKIIFFNQDKGKLADITYQLPKSIQFMDYNLCFQHSDLIITLGGDGTLIGVCRSMNEFFPPILSVSMGKLGFITQFNAEELLKILDDPSFGNLQTSEISVYQAQLIRNGQLLYSAHFINDAVVHKNDISRIFSLSAYHNDQHVYDLSGDGLIVATPLGSTAYSLSAGGPLIYPRVAALALTPICTHGLTHRPIVLPDDSSIKIIPIERVEHIALTLDGQQAFDVNLNDQIIISKKQRSAVKVFANNKKTYFENLKSKFSS